MDYTTKSCREFVTVLASNEPAPGGGGASALVAAIGTALGNMVGSLTVGKKKYADVEAEIIALQEEVRRPPDRAAGSGAADAEGFIPGQRLRHPTRNHRHQGRQLQQPRRVQTDAVRHLPGSVHRAIRTDAEPVPARPIADLRQGPLPRIRPRRPTTRRPRSPVQGTRHRHRPTYLHHQRSPRTPQQAKTQGRQRTRHPAQRAHRRPDQPQRRAKPKDRGNAQLPDNAEEGDGS